RHTTVSLEASTPPELFYLCDLTATTEGSGAPVTTFARPITFTVSYGPADTARRPGAALTLYWFNPVAGRWLPLPSQVSAGVIIATTSHFTLFAAGASGPGYGKDVLPTLRGIASDLWTGAATLQQPFTLPPGPAGFDLGLSLGYNSQGINELVQSVGQGSPSQYLAQGSWTGLGWSLGGLGQISRPLNSYDKLYLGFAGGTFELKNLGSGNWTTEPQAFVRLQHNGDERSPNPWLAWTPDGTQYTFGNPAGTVGNGTAYTAFWTDWNTNCSVRAYQWALTGITDTHGNRWQIAYDHEYKDVSSANGCGGDPGKYIRATYPATITLTPSGAASPTVRVRLVRESRPDFQIDKYNDPYVQNLWGMYRLKQVLVEVYNGGAWQQARRYDLAYSVPTLHSLLTAVTTYGVDATALVTATFTYGGQYNYTRLASANNGYGGVVTYTYQTDFVANNAGCTSYEWQVVGNRQTADGLGNVFTTTYGYLGAYAWVDPVGCPEVPRSSYEFLGHTIVTETVKEKDGTIASVSEQRYYQKLANGSPDPRKGKTYLVSTFPAVGSPALAQTESKWVTETVNSTSFVHLEVVTQTTGSQAAVTKYYYDLDHQGNTQYGNLTRLVEYGAGASPYRTTERWFYPRNDAGGYIVNRVGEEKVLDGAGTCQAQKRYFYDGNASHTSPPSKGDLTRLSQAPGACNGTLLDTRYGYDTWGNQTVITNALGYTTTTQYDASFRTYPITVTNALGQRTLAQYDYRFGKPTVVTDVNNIPTTYVYDSFGRITAEVRWGDTTANPTVRYNYYAFGTPGLQQITIGRREYSGQTDHWGHWESHLFNGLGQIVQVHTEIDDTLAQNNESRVTRFYNSRGLLESELAPYLGTHSENGGYGAYGYVPPGSSLPRTRYAYDALGRVTVITDTAGVTGTQSYSGWTVTAVDGNRHQKFLENDAFG
ncbi:MAG: RHS repeat protein, partial [Chloroflexi bacterium]|nr:RHS repeat protein [Chloroflexota bacterium]